MRDITDRYMNSIPWIIIIYIGVAYAFMGFYTPLIGDDLGYCHSFASMGEGWLAWPRWLYRKWLFTNARMADVITPIGVYVMPVWLRALTNGLVTSMLFWVVIRQCGRAGYLRDMLIIALIAFTFRWDAIWMEFCTSYGYVWAAAFALAAIGLLFRHKADPGAWYWWASVPLCFVAANMHEASGLPLSIGLILYLVITGSFRRFAAVEKAMVIFFVGGGLFSITSPASYTRVGSMLQPESPVEMLLLSAGYVVLLAVLSVWMLCRRRALLLGMIRSPWVIFASAALVSAVFMLQSQYGGRTGWFAQIFALVAIFRVLGRLDLRVSAKLAVPLTIVLALAVISHYSALMVWQKRLGTETREAIALYRNAPDGIIYMDYVNEPELPWYLLRKTHGVPDDDDTYYRDRMTLHKAHGKPPVILPSAAQGVDWHCVTGRLWFGDKFVATEPLDGGYIDKIVEQYPRTMVRVDGREYIESAFDLDGRRLYLYSPVDRDPGEK